MMTLAKSRRKSWKSLHNRPGRLRPELDRLSTNDSLSSLDRHKIRELAGTWKMSDKEINRILSSLEKGWGNYKVED
jgi:hypothetical protein